MVIFRKIVIILLGRNTPNKKFLDVVNKGTIFYEPGAINIYLNGAANSFSPVLVLALVLVLVMILVFT